MHISPLVLIVCLIHATSGRACLPCSAYSASQPLKPVIHQCRIATSLLFFGGVRFRFVGHVTRCDSRLRHRLVAASLACCLHSFPIFSVPQKLVADLSYTCDRTPSIVIMKLHYIGVCCPEPRARIRSRGRPELTRALSPSFNRLSATKTSPHTSLWPKRSSAPTRDSHETSTPARLLSRTTFRMLPCRSDGGAERSLPLTDL